MQLAEANLSRPKQVTIAVALLYLSYGLRIFGKIVEFVEVHLEPKQFWFLLIIFIVTLAISLFLIYLISKGRDWARLALLAMFIYIKIPPIVLWRWNPSTPNQIIDILFFCHFALQLVAFVFMFQAGSNAWFSRSGTIAPQTQFDVNIPKLIKTAITLLYVNIGISLSKSVQGIAAVFLGIMEIPPNSSLIGLFLKIAIGYSWALFLTYNISKGKNWARITFLVIFIVGRSAECIYVLVRGISPAEFIHNPNMLFSWIFSSVLNLIALVFIFQKESNEWFKKSRQISQAI